MENIGIMLKMPHFIGILFSSARPSVKRKNGNATLYTVFYCFTDLFHYLCHCFK